MVAPVSSSPSNRTSEILFLIVLATGALALGLAMTFGVMEALPHLEDEIAYQYQARVFAGGALCGPLAPDLEAFSTPFLINVEGCRLGKYPIGWPLLLALGERFGAGWLVNPLMGAALALISYALARELFGQRAAQAAGILCILSPFFLIQAGTIMAHLSGAVWTGLFVLAMVKIEAGGREKEIEQRAWRAMPLQGWAATGGIALGLLALTRPTSALALGLPFGGYVLWRLIRREMALRTALLLGISALLVAGMQPLFLWVTTGSPTTNLYTLIWPFDRLGFGPGYGPYAGHTLRQGLITTWQDVELWTSELFGLPVLSWLPVAVGLLIAARLPQAQRRVWAGLLIAPLLLLVGLHTAYWVGAQVYGPRYYFEAQALICALAGAGIAGTNTTGLIALIQNKGFARFSRAGVKTSPHGMADDPLVAEDTASKHSSLKPGPANGVTALLLIAITLINASIYLPGRLAFWRELYGIERAPLATLETLRGESPALVFVSGERWIDFAAFFSLNEPWYQGPVIAAHDLGAAHNARIARLYPDRELFSFDGETLRPCESTWCSAPDS